MAESVKVTVDGDTYELSPLGFSDLVRMEEWARAEVVREGRERLEILADVLDEATRDKMLLAAVDAAADPVKVGAMMDSLAGLVKRVELSLKVKHPDITKAQIDKVLGAEGIAQIVEQVGSVVGLDETGAARG